MADGWFCRKRESGACGIAPAKPYGALMLLPSIALLDVPLPEIVAVFALKPLGSVTIVLIDLYHSRGLSGTDEGVLQGGAFQFAFRDNPFHLQNMDDGGNASGRLFPPKQDRRVKDFFADLELQGFTPTVGLQPVNPLLVVRGEISLKGAHGYAGTLADVFFIAGATN